MLLVSFILVNILFLILFSIYLKLMCGTCKSKRHLVGKTVIVTGGDSGIGFETVKDLADRGARVIFSSIDKKLGEETRQRIVKVTGNKDIHFYLLDLTSFKSIRTFADYILKTEKRLDVLINNAGVYSSGNVKTEDGLLQGMQTNYFGPFLLTNLLLPLLKSSAPSRIVNVASRAHSTGKIDFQNLEKNLKKFHTADVYQNSKLCVVVWSREMSRRLKGTGVTVNSLHPGIVDTTIVTTKNIQIKLLEYIWPLFRPFMKTPWEGAQTTIYLAVDPEVSQLSGGYYADCRLAVPSSLVEDTEIGRKLWEVSERLVKIK